MSRSVMQMQIRINPIHPALNENTPSDPEPPAIKSLSHDQMFIVTLLTASAWSSGCWVGVSIQQASHLQGHLGVGATATGVQIMAEAAWLRANGDAPVAARCYELARAGLVKVGNDGYVYPTQKLAKLIAG